MISLFDKMWQMFAGELFTDSVDKHDSDMLKDNILGFACFRKVLAAKY